MVQCDLEPTWQKKRRSPMRKSIPIKARSCCLHEKERVVNELQFCEFSALTPEQRSGCFQQVARSSGERAKECLYS